MNIGWPEGIIIGLAALELFGAFVKDGEPRSNHSFPWRVIDTACLFGLLYWGGFFA